MPGNKKERALNTNRVLLFFPFLVGMMASNGYVYYFKKEEILSKLKRLDFVESNGHICFMIRLLFTFDQRETSDVFYRMEHA